MQIWEMMSLLKIINKKWLHYHCNIDYHFYQVGKVLKKITFWYLENLVKIKDPKMLKCIKRTKNPADFRARKKMGSIGNVA